MNDVLNSLTAESGAISQLARQFGLTPQQAEGAVQGLAPALTGAMARNARQPGGLEALQNALASGGHTRYVDDPASLTDPAATEEGNKILGHLLGSKDESRRVAGEGARATGIDVDILKQMLPLVADMVMGSTGKRAGGASGIGGLGALIEGFGGAGATSGGGGGPTGGGGLGGLLGKLMGRRGR
jgi:hypothetical protein